VPISTYLSKSKATIESRIWLVVIVLILAIGQIAINRQVSSFHNQVIHFHNANVIRTQLQIKTSKENHDELLRLQREITALRNQANGARSSK